MIKDFIRAEYEYCEPVILPCWKFLKGAYLYFYRFLHAWFSLLFLLVCIGAGIATVLGGLYVGIMILMAGGVEQFRETGSWIGIGKCFLSIVPIVIGYLLGLTIVRFAIRP